MVPAQNLFPFVTMPAFQFSIGKELSAVLSPWLVVMRVRPGHQTQTGFKNFRYFTGFNNCTVQVVSITCYYKGQRLREITASPAPGALCQQ